MTPLITRLKCISAGLMIFCFLLTGTVFAQKATTQAKTAYTISGITLDQTADGLQLVVQGRTPPTYTMYELFDPLRIVLDIADARLLDSTVIPLNLPQGPVQDIKNIALTDQEPAIARLEIYLSGDPAYTIERKGGNIVVSFAKTMPLPLAQTITDGEQQPATIASPSTHPASLLQDIEIDTTNPAETHIFIKTDGPITAFHKAHLVKSDGRPARMYIDIENVALPGKMLQHTVGTALGKIRAAQRNSAVRIVFDSGLNELFTYEVENMPDGLLVKIAEPAASLSTPIVASRPKQSLTKKTTSQQNKTKALSPQTASGVFSDVAATPPVFVTPVASMPAITTPELIVPILSTTKYESKTVPTQLVRGATQTPTTATTSAKKTLGTTNTKAESFNLSGYEKQKITVDFFKIDLHNVFRLFGEISGQNIVVDETVNGTLTLALNDIPWDFALDIILNLKGLQKEGRFNTIVIFPKDKNFQFPKVALDHTDTTKNKDQPDLAAATIQLKEHKEILEAKKLIQQGELAEKSGHHAQALSLYEAAFNSWPDNIQLANHISSLCLVQLGMNAKAVHYAKAALTLEPANTGAALQAAIGSANMKKTEAAKTYFDLAIRAPRPASEALTSYAAFAEEQRSYRGALTLLDKHNELYGDTLDTLVSRARILDSLGETTQALATYNAVLLSGYTVPEELQRFIQGRLAAAN
ncbi:MAG: AMIN domain-containing protein [Deltaproteobacteria bacterium]|nr:AMIN domain-containing protein [Deltaproteobacteria bacterium]